jgi:adenylosuccinate lyase
VFLATDGLFQTLLTVLDELGVYPAVVQRELDRYLPFLATTAVLVAAVQRGVGRETAHAAIKEHAIAVALDLRAGATHNDLVDRLATDARLGLDRQQIEALMSDPAAFVGAASSQVQRVAAEVDEVAARYPEAASYTPPPIV